MKAFLGCLTCGGTGTDEAQHHNSILKVKLSQNQRQLNFAKVSMDQLCLYRSRIQAMGALLAT